MSKVRVLNGLPMDFPMHEAMVWVLADDTGKPCALSSKDGAMLYAFQDPALVNEFVQQVRDLNPGGEINLALLLQRDLEKHLLAHLHLVSGVAILGNQTDGEIAWFEFPTAAFAAES